MYKEMMYIHVYPSTYDIRVQMTFHNHVLVNTQDGNYKLICLKILSRPTLVKHPPSWCGFPPLKKSVFSGSTKSPVTSMASVERWTPPSVTSYFRSLVTPISPPSITPSGGTVPSPQPASPATYMATTP